jgi:aryl-alcohol dehydrogenase-like predicted oxidoreductase
MVEKLGVSIYAPRELEEIAKQFSLDLVQAPFNLVDHRLHTTGWLQRLKDNDIEIHTRSAFLQGLLLMSQSAIPLKFSPWSSLFGKWHQWLLENDLSAIQACLAFPLLFTEIDRVVVGAENANQLAQIIDAANNVAQISLPDLHCEEENLINPSRWPSL